MEDLKYIGIGLVSTPLTHGKRTIGVHLPGQFPFMSGEITLNPGMMTTKGKDSRGRPYIAKVETNSVITAEWWPDDHNQLTAPMVQTGQRVQIWRNAKTEMYLWRSANMDPSLSVQETVVKAYAAKGKDGKEETLTPENSYMTSFSTANKEISLKTSKANGEPVAFDVQINTKDGVILYKDDKGNIVQFDAVENRITAKNANGSYLDIDKNNVTVEAPDTINIKAGKQINLEAPTFNLKDNEVKWQASKITVNCPDNEFVGVVKMGAMSTTGNGGNGGGSISGNMEIKGQTTIIGSTTIKSPVLLSGGHSTADITGLSYRK